MAHIEFCLKSILPLVLSLTLICCHVQYEDKPGSILVEESNPFVGAWLLDHVTREDSTGNIQTVDMFSRALLMYSEDGYMSAILSYSEAFADAPGQDVGYCGRYEIDTGKRSVSHLRDVIAINSDTEGIIYVRDYAFSDDNKVLTLSPREASRKGMSLTWKRVD